MKEPNSDQRKVASNVAKALAEVPIDNKQERDALRARLRHTYAGLEATKDRTSIKDRQRFEELGELIDRLEECESRPPQTRA
jgi:hypothetical protein